MYVSWKVIIYELLCTCVCVMVHTYMIAHPWIILLSLKLFLTACGQTHILSVSQTKDIMEQEVI